MKKKILVKYYTDGSMSSAEKKNTLGRLTGGSEHEKREALQLRAYNDHFQSNKTLQGIAVSADSVASAEQRTRIIIIWRRKRTGDGEQRERRVAPLSVCVGNLVNHKRDLRIG